MGIHQLLARIPEKDKEVFRAVWTRRSYGEGGCLGTASAVDLRVSR